MWKSTGEGRTRGGYRAGSRRYPDSLTSPAEVKGLAFGRRGWDLRSTLVKPSRPRGGGASTSQGHPTAILKRALQRGNLTVAEAVAKELPPLNLTDALELTIVIARKDPRPPNHKVLLLPTSFQSARNARSNETSRRSIGGDTVAPSIHAVPGASQGSPARSHPGRRRRQSPTTGRSRLRFVRAGSLDTRCASSASPGLRRESAAAMISAAASRD